MLDKILIPGIPVKARVGCTDEERSKPQVIEIDLALRCNVQEAAEADRIEAAINYVAVREETERVAASQPFRLIETIAVEIANRLLAAFPAEEVQVRVRKPSALAQFDVPWAGVEVVRSRRA